MDRMFANGIDIAYRFDEPSEAITGPPCVMLCNGIMSNFSMWDQQIPALTDRYRVLRFDNRGHGGTQLTPPPYSMETLAADACNLLDALGINRVHFVGASLGGMVGQLFAIKYPDRLQSLAFLGTLSGLETYPAFKMALFWHRIRFKIVAFGSTFKPPKKCGLSRRSAS